MSSLHRSMATFKELGLSEPILEALGHLGYDKPTPIQEEAIPMLLAGRDVIGQAQTGTGKTAAFGLPLLEYVDPESQDVEALVLTPTRELCIQVTQALRAYGEKRNIDVVAVFGGAPIRDQMARLRRGDGQVVVGTVGRVMDLMSRHALVLNGTRFVVLDEADEMLDLGFREDMEFILQATPDDRRTLLFSATLPRGIVALAKEYQQEAFRVEVAGDEGGHADIEYRAIRIAAGDVEHAVVNLLRYYESPGTLVFCNTRDAVRHLQATLLERGFSVVALSGELTQNERTLALQALRDGRARVCVATDVAARGIDLPNLDLVIHADLPNDPEVMQHRSGRTGRAGRKGVSILLVPPARRRRADMLLKLAGIDATMGLAPQPDEIRKLDQERMLRDDLFAAETTPEDLVLAQALLAERTAEEIAAALARLYRGRLPSPEDIIDPGEDRVKSRAERTRERAERQEGRGSARHGMAEESVWFSVAVGRTKNAEARWLLPMLCRRGSVKKDDIGNIRILENTTEIEISARVASRFAARIRRPDKGDNIRIEPMKDAPRQDAPRQEVREKEWKPKPHGKNAKGSDKPAFDKKAHFDTKRRDRGEQAHAGKPRQEHAPAKPAFGKKKKKKFRG